MNDNLWEILQNLDNIISNSLWKVEFVEASQTYTFTSKLNEEVVYVVVLKNDAIYSITYRAETYTFDYSMKDYYVRSLESVKNGYYIIKRNEKSHRNYRNGKRRQDHAGALPRDRTRIRAKLCRTH